MPLPTRPLLLVLDRDPHYAGLLAASLPFNVVRVPSWRRLFAAVAAAPPSTVACVDPYIDARPDSLAHELAGLLRLLPSTRVVAALDLSAVPVSDVLLLGRIGVAEVVGRAAIDVRTAVQRIHSLSQPPLVLRLDHAFDGRIDPGVRALVRTAAELAGTGRGGPTLADRLYVSERTLLRACVRMGIPSPRRLMSWTRVLHAVALMHEPGRRPRDVAAAAGFGCDRVLRRAVRRHLGCSLEELRRADAFPRAVRRFLRALRAPAGQPAPHDRESAGRRLSATVS